MNRNSLGTTLTFVLKRMFRGEEYTSAIKNVAQELPNPVTHQTVNERCTRALGIKADDFRLYVWKIKDLSLQEPFLKMIENAKPQEIRFLFESFIKHHKLV